MEVWPLPVTKNILPSRYNEGNSPSGEMTTGPSGKASPSCNGRRMIRFICLSERLQTKKLKELKHYEKSDFEIQIFDVLFLSYLDVLFPSYLAVLQCKIFAEADTFLFLLFSFLFVTVSSRLLLFFFGCPLFSFIVFFKSQSLYFRALVSFHLLNEKSRILFKQKLYI